MQGIMNDSFQVAQLHSLNVSGLLSKWIDRQHPGFFLHCKTPIKHVQKADNQLLSSTPGSENMIAFLNSSQRILLDEKTKLE
jgi:hypothetical protein